jgi:phosphoribosyl 1,2-cyclic phosphodiesterase
MLRLRSLGSGSSGNATVVEAHSGHSVTRLLVDCGFGLRALERRLALASLGTGDIDAIFITHEHGDHIGSARALALRERIPVWMSHGTWQAHGAADFDGLLNTAVHDQAIEIGDLHLHPFAVPHDAREPLQLTCTDGATRLGVLTDLGHAPADVLMQLADCSWNATMIRTCWRRRATPRFSSAAWGVSTVTWRMPPRQPCCKPCDTTG